MKFLIIIILIIIIINAREASAAAEFAASRKTRGFGVSSREG